MKAIFSDGIYKTIPCHLCIQPGLNVTNVQMSLKNVKNVQMSLKTLLELMDALGVASFVNKPLKLHVT